MCCAPIWVEIKYPSLAAACLLNNVEYTDVAQYSLLLHQWNIAYYPAADVQIILCVCLGIILFVL